MAAVETAKERWCEAEVNRIAGEIALLSPEPAVARAGEYFERALAVARAQQAKSWELRAAISMARLWRDQGRRDEARERPDHRARFFRGALLAQSGDLQLGIELMRNAMAAVEASAERNRRTLHLGHLASAHASLGQPEIGLDLLDDAIRTAEVTAKQERSPGSGRG